MRILIHQPSSNVIRSFIIKHKLKEIVEMCNDIKSTFFGLEIGGVLSFFMHEAAELTMDGKGGNIYLTEKGRNNKY